MKKKMLWMPILTILLTSLCVTDTAVSSPATVVGTHPKPSTAPLATSFDLNITVTDVVDLYGWQFNMTFNSTVLNAVAVTEGPFLMEFADSVGVFTWWLGETIDNTNGWVFAGCSLFPFPDPPDGADGSGVLATVTFSVVTKGRSDLHYLDTLVNTYNATSGLPEAIPHTTEDGFFQLPLGDANNDGVVDIFDIGTISAHWYPGPPVGPLGYSADADINKDGAVDIFDIGIASAHWGES